MQMIITMAGLGTRFRKAGYDCPKYMIEARGKTLFEWSMDSLLDFNGYISKYVFVVRAEDRAGNFIRRQCEKYEIRNVELVELDHMTDGQATTCMRAISCCNPDESVMVYNIDTYVEPYEMKYADISGDGYIPCFQAEGTHFSFARLDENGKVAEVREKVRISDNCTLGAYYFSSARLYKQIYEEYYTGDRKMDRSEKYIAPLYNFMIQKGLSVTISIVESNKVHVLGTPEELKEFIKLSDV